MGQLLLEAGERPGLPCGSYGGLGLLLALSSYFLLKNYEYTGSPGGTALLAIHNGLGGSEDDVMRTFDSGDTFGK